MSSMLYRLLDWPKYVVQVLPLWLRTQPRFTDLLRVLSSPFRLLNQDLVAYRTMLLSEYQGSGQRLVLERILRDRCAGSAPKIWVLHGSLARDEYELFDRRRPSNLVYGYTRAEAVEGSVGYVYLRTELYTDGPPDFIVNVATAHWATMSNQDRQLLVTLIERFKVYGTTYEINQI